MPIVIIGGRCAKHGANETAKHSGIAATDRVPDEGACAGANQRAGKFVRRRGNRVGQGDKTSQQKTRGKISGFHDQLLK
jgi:hypothetical protein